MYIYISYVALYTCIILNLALFLFFLMEELIRVLEISESNILFFNAYLLRASFINKNAQKICKNNILI